MINITTIRKRMTKGFLLMMLFLAQSVVSSAQVKLYMENFTLSSGEKKQVSLLLDNDKTATQMQVEITLPNGMSYVDESAAKTTRVKGRGATVQASTVTGKLVIVETGGTVEAGSGEVITFEVEDKNLKVGDHKITLSNIIISDANGDQLNQEETNTVTVKKLGLGDCLFAGPENLNVVGEVEAALLRLEVPPVELAYPYHGKAEFLHRGDVLRPVFPWPRLRVVCASELHRTRAGLGADCGGRPSRRKKGECRCQLHLLHFIVSL